MQKIIYTNSRGESITLGNTKPFLLTSIEGTGAVDTDIQMQKAPFQDGASHIDTLLEPRELPIQASILASNKQEVYEYRQQLSRVLNPKLKGKLRYEYDGGVKEIECAVDQAPVYPVGSDNRGEEYQRFVLSLLCPSPFWLDYYITSQEMSYLLGGLSFPLQLGTTFSNRGFRKMIENKGDVSAPVTIEFYGPAINPTVKNLTTNEMVKVKRNLLDSEKLVITTEFGNKSVKVVDENGQETNIFNWIDLDSVFWQMAVGENLLEYTSDDDNTKAKVFVKFKNRYVGI